jgi:hypothetical protein
MTKTQQPTASQTTRLHRALDELFEAGESSEAHGIAREVREGISHSRATVLIRHAEMFLQFGREPMYP